MTSCAASLHADIVDDWIALGIHILICILKNWGT